MRRRQLVNATPPPELTARGRPGGRLIRWAVRLCVLGAVLLAGASGIMERLFYQPHVGPTPAPTGVELVRFPSSDGTMLTGWFIPATRSASGVAPTVVQVHGNAGAMPDHVAITAALPPAGFNVFLFDYRGYGESAGRPVRRGPLIADTQAALDAVLARDDVDARRIAIYGQSLGAAIGLNVMAERKEIRCGAFESSFSSWRDMAADALAISMPRWVAVVVARWLIGDNDRPDEAIARIERPMLVLHGTADRMVPVHHAHRLEACGGDHVTLVLLEGGDHNTVHFTHTWMEERLVAFLHEHLDP